MASNSQLEPAAQTPLPESSTSTPRRNMTSLSKEDREELSAQEDTTKPPRWSMGILNDLYTHEVPGSVLLLSNERNEPLGLRNTPATTSGSSLPAQPSITSPKPISRRASTEGKKKTADGTIILEPQPDDSKNDPLNWPSWRRDAALISLGLYCMVGGGMTPILAAGFNDVAATYSVTHSQIALTTGLYMMGLGIGSVIFSPTAILFGKRPVYLCSAIIFMATSIWCALSPSYISLLVARIIQGISVAPVECLPSATIAEIFFLHERAFRIGIYTLLLLGGKNLVPLVSAAVIQSYGWRWVFWIVAMVVLACWGLMFLFVPESFWERTPHPKSRRSSNIIPPVDVSSRIDSSNGGIEGIKQVDGQADSTDSASMKAEIESGDSPTAPRKVRVRFAGDASCDEPSRDIYASKDESGTHAEESSAQDVSTNTTTPDRALHKIIHNTRGERAQHTPGRLHNFNSPFYHDDMEKQDSNYFPNNRGLSPVVHTATDSTLNSDQPGQMLYTTHLQTRPTLTFTQQLRPYNGRLTNDNFFKVMLRPFILFAYPAVLWSSIVYACSVGWLIVLSESVSEIYRSPHTYHFSALATGLIYLSPFIGGILGTAVAGKVSDIIVRYMSRRNNGLYEPEFRLVMAVPVAITTVIGLMGFGWSAEKHDAWIVPTIFFGIISFGCSLGSTTAITFCVDSYRQYAGEALVTLNFSKNIFHGLVFSLFVNRWLEKEGSKSVFIWLGVIQLVLMGATVPMYIFGKRARMWTVRMNLMERF